MGVGKVMVLGAGFMGSGIAQVALQSGYNVVLRDLNDELLEKGRSTIVKNLQRRVAKGKLDEEKVVEYMSLLETTTDLGRARDVELIIESVVEDVEIKQNLFRELDAICPPDVIFATNTSSIPITEIAAATKRPDRFIGMHFFSPAPVMKLVEVINGLKTSDDVTKLILETARNFGKEPVVVKDGPGFLVNRINNALRIEAYKCLEEGVASIEDIDKAMKLGLGHPMGPFELADFVGLDVGYNLLETLWGNFKDPKWRPSLLLKKLVLSGDLGRKTGKGWYEYEGKEKKVRNDLNL
ncbi:MAG TPA: 3-hydroxyacyl-CoA dehydrogenase family protein [Clostridia bacterium]|nr:3-hydroxyacyl-CoA dehydrogenase family protein [Clostridia bacterium]